MMSLGYCFSLSALLVGFLLDGYPGSKVATSECEPDTPEL